MTNLEVVVETLRRRAKSGSRARATLDVDLLTGDSRVLDDSFWKEVVSAGRHVEIRRGDADDPLRGVVRIKGEQPVDVAVARYKWQQDIIERASSTSIGELTVPVPSAADLILLKLFAGGYLDLREIAILLAIGPREELVAEVTAALAPLPADTRSRWDKLLLDLRDS